MKNPVFALLALAFSLSLSAQDLIEGYEFAEIGTIYLTDKDSIEGVLGFSQFKNNQVVLVGEEQTKYKTDDIRGFYLKTSDIHFVSGRYALSKTFMQVAVRGKKASIVKTFVSSSDEKLEPGKVPEGTWPISLYLTDKGENFEASKKIAEAIKPACPELAAKLVQKNSEYFVNLFTVEEDMIKAYKKIIEELDAGCK
jgi:hypothetical protein